MSMLVGDIGGTNTRLVIADLVDDEIVVQAKKVYSSTEFPEFGQVLDKFLSEHDCSSDLDSACFAVAGPVESGLAKVTNLPWVIDERTLAQQFKIKRIKLINDFIAVAYGVFELQEPDLLLLQEGNAELNKLSCHDAAVIGAGTGFGVSHLVWCNDSYRALASETGHSGFAPENQYQRELLGWLQKQDSHVSLETLLSGRGLHTIYQYFRDVCGITESPTVKETMRSKDPASVISEYADYEDDLCKKAIECFVDIYGAAAGNVALHYYPIKTLYIAGGIAAKNKQRMLNGRFVDAFIEKGLMKQNLRKITIKLIIEEDVGLLGALAQARILLY